MLFREVLALVVASLWDTFREKLTLCSGLLDVAPLSHLHACQRYLEYPFPCVVQLYGFVHSGSFYQGIPP